MTRTPVPPSPPNVPTTSPPATEPTRGSRLQLALNVDDLGQAIEFYSRLFATEPSKVEPGYANFAIADPPLKLVLFEAPGQGGTLNHLGIEVPTTAAVAAAQSRLASAGLATTAEMGTTCCYAAQDKVWVDGPSADRWEIYTVLSDTEQFGAAPATPDGVRCACEPADPVAVEHTPDDARATCCP